MNDAFSTTLVALGRGVIKFLVSVFVGTGTGLVTFGMTTQGKPEIWEMRNPPGEMFLSVGVGLLTTGAVLAAAFILPKLAAKGTTDTAKPVTNQEWSS